MRDDVAIYPAKHFVTTADKMAVAIKDIQEELDDRLKELEAPARFSRRRGCGSGRTTTWR